MQRIYLIFLISYSHASNTEAWLDFSTTAHKVARQQFNPEQIFKDLKNSHRISQKKIEINKKNYLHACTDKSVQSNNNRENKDLEKIINSSMYQTVINNLFGY